MPTQFNTLCSEATLHDAWNTVKQKGAAGGIDGITIESFNKDRLSQIKQLKEELMNGEWKPQPYLQIAIPKTKNPNELRILGMAAIRDKIVQQAIRSIIEPRLERLFLANSYAYRPKKGALKTIKYIIRQCGNKEYQFALRLDIDNFFDEIDHSILQQRLTAIGIENELIRLIMLSMKMGRVSKNTNVCSPMCNIVVCVPSWQRLLSERRTGLTSIQCAENVMPVFNIFPTQRLKSL